MSINHSNEEPRKVTLRSSLRTPFLRCHGDFRALSSALYCLYIVVRHVCTGHGRLQIRESYSRSTT